MKLCSKLVVVVLAATFVAAEQSDFKLGDKWVSVIENTSAGKLWLENKRWTLSADAGSKIKVFCTDFRTRGGATEEEKCALGSLVLNDGISEAKYCGTQYDLVVLGNSSSLVIDFITDPRGGAFLECVAKAVRQSINYETVEISPGSGIKKISFPAALGEDNDKAWRFKSTTADKISLHCTRRMESALGTGVCVKDVLTIDAGKGPKVSCGYEPVTALSEGTEITMRVETFVETEGQVECIVRSNSDSDPKEVPEDDSDEHGVSPGQKTTTCPCGKANRDSGRVINGTEVKYESKYPWMVSLRFPGGGHTCGASVISPIHILTAAHCVSEYRSKSSPEAASVHPTVGAHATWNDASHGETQKLEVKEVHIPKEWFAVKGNLAGDIAILVLTKPMRMSKWVSPVCLTPTQPDVVHKYIRIMGWGRTENGTPDILREANALVLSPQECNNNVKEICFKSGPSSSCFGDSGGPYVYRDPETNRYTQIGVVSYVYGECSGRFFVGTNTAYWYDWIQKIVSETSGGHGICQKVD